MINNNLRFLIVVPQGVKVNFQNGKVLFPKLKWINCYFSRTFEGKIKTCTISQTSTGKYYISILVDNNQPFPQKKEINECTAVGLDLGIKDFLITSEGEKFENQKFLISSLRKLRIAQRSLSRKVKFSNNWYRQLKIVVRIHEKVKNQRKDFLHKLSTYLVQTYDTICLESLNVAGMIKNPNLAKHIADQGWTIFKDFLKYKCEWYGKSFNQIDRWFPSSKTCSCCKVKNKDLKLSDRTWTCDGCGTEHDRDINAAINIKKEGLRLTLCPLT